MNRANQAYGEVELTTDIMTASNHKLIQMLIDKSMQHIEMARNFLINNEMPKKGEAITKALNIIEYLRICLNHDEPKAKELSALLDSLYAYLQLNLLEANLNNNIENLNQAKSVLANIKEGWDGISQ